MAQQNQPDHARQGKALASRVKQLRGHVGTDPAKADQLADALNELTANRLVAHQFQEATAEAQEAVTAAFRLLNEAGPVGAYTPPPVAARYYTAVTHVAVAQDGLGMSQAAGGTMRTLDDFRAQLTRPLARALPARTAVWALAVQGRACLASGDVPGANAWADAALTRVERSGLRNDAAEMPVVLDTEQLVSDARWAAGRPDESLQHLWSARLGHAGWAAEQLANAARLSPAMLRLYALPLVRIDTALAERLASLGRDGEASGVRRGLVDTLKPIAGRMGAEGKQLLTEAQHEVELNPTAGPVPERIEGWAPVFGEATLAPEFEDAEGRTVEPAADIETLAAQRAAARAEADRREREAAEAARIEAERLDAERAERRAQVERERAEAERLAAKQTERERAEQAAAAERERAEQEERERLEQLEAENARLEQESRDRQDEERVAAERAEATAVAEAERVRAQETADAERERAERLEQERLEQERAEQERLGRERAEQAEAERVQREEAERLERKRLEHERIRAAEQERRDRERAEASEREQAEREQAERERSEQERAEQERAEQEQAASDPAVDRWERAVAQLAAERQEGGRRAVRDAATEVVESLRGLAASDPGRWNHTLGEALEDLAQARRGVADLWGARQASREAKDLLG